MSQSDEAIRNDDPVVAANDELLYSVGVQPEAVAPPPWPELPGGRAQPWDEFARFTDLWEGHIVAGLLKAEGVPVIVELLGPSVDLTSTAVIHVPRELIHRARWVVAWPAPSEAELIFLATGELAP